MNNQDIARQLFVKINKSIPIKDEWISAALAKKVIVFILKMLLIL